FGLDRGFGRGRLASNPMDLLVRDAQRRKQQFPCHAEIAFRVLGRNAALITPEKIERLEGRASCSGKLNNSLKEAPGNSTAQKSYAIRVGPGCQRDFLEPLLRGCLSQDSIIWKWQNLTIA